MSTSGRVNAVQIKDDNDPDDIRSFSNVKLTLIKERSAHILVITIASDEEIELNLNDCSYVEESSIIGKIECIRDNHGKQLVIIKTQKEQCVDLLDQVRKYLKGRGKPRSRSRSPSPSPSPPRSRPAQRNNNVKVDELIRALNDGNAKNAADIARELARSQEQVRFTLNMINESGNETPLPPPKPVEQPLRLKLSIESFLIENNTDQQYDVAILRSTTITDLKRIVTRDAQIAPGQQYWYINREHLPDNYVFDGTKTPRANEGTVLTLYIAKPQNP